MDKTFERSLPDDALQLKSQELAKLCSSDEWKMRRLVASSELLMITHVGSEMIIDTIPLFEIESVEMLTEGGGTNKRRASLRSASVEDDNSFVRLRSMSWSAPESSSFKGGDARFGALSSPEGGVTDNSGFTFAIRTNPEGFNSGRSYFFRTSDIRSCQSWIADLKSWAKQARKKHEQLSRIMRIQTAVRRVYASTSTQTFIALLIVGNFIVSAYETQANPQKSGGLDAFRSIDLLFTIAFTFELAINAFANWLTPFISDGWNWFDMLVVVASILSLLLETASGLRGLRMIRALRVIRVVRRMANLRSLVNSLTASVFPVINAMLIVFLTCCVYAVIGVNLFRERDDLLFGSFARALFTMFQVSTMDGWARASRELFSSDDLDPGVSLFFMSFIVIVTWTLLPVVVAVLLENFTYANKKEKEREEEARMAEKRGPTHQNALDPLCAAMLHYHDDADLTKNIGTLYRLLDADNKGSLKYDELVEGVRKIPTLRGMHLSHEDFQTLTDHYRLCDHGRGLSAAAFESMVRVQMKKYVLRQMDAAVRMTEQEDIPSYWLLSAVKILILLVDKPATTRSRTESDKLGLGSARGALKNDGSRTPTSDGRQWAGVSRRSSSEEGNDQFDQHVACPVPDSPTLLHSVSASEEDQASSKEHTPRQAVDLSPSAGAKMAELDAEMRGLSSRLDTLQRSLDRIAFEQPRRQSLKHTTSRDHGCANVITGPRFGVLPPTTTSTEDPTITRHAKDCDQPSNDDRDQDSNNDREPALASNAPRLSLDVGGGISWPRHKPRAVLSEAGTLRLLRAGHRQQPSMSPVDCAVPDCRLSPMPAAMPQPREKSVDLRATPPLLAAAVTSSETGVALYGGQPEFGFNNERFRFAASASDDGAQASSASQPILPAAHRRKGAEGLWLSGRADWEARIQHGRPNTVMESCFDGHSQIRAKTDAQPTAFQDGASNAKHHHHCICRTPSWSADTAAMFQRLTSIGTDVSSASTHEPACNKLPDERRQRRKDQGAGARSTATLAENQRTPSSLSTSACPPVVVAEIGFERATSPIQAPRRFSASLPTEGLDSGASSPIVNPRTAEA